MSPKTPFRDLHPAAKVFAILATALLIVVAVAVLALLGKAAVSAYLWLWNRL